jgi:PIN domain nuclease of toxin-antitoxin system
MKLLLDTHAFIWWHNKPDRLSPRVLRLCQDSTNTLLLSVVTVWEMQIKLQLGKLQLQSSLVEIIESQQKTNNLEILPVRLAHVMELDNFPPHHKDPFDRLLIAQGQVEEATLLSSDPVFTKYTTRVLW